MISITETITKSTRNAHRPYVSFTVILDTGVAFGFDIPVGALTSAKKWNKSIRIAAEIAKAHEIVLDWIEIRKRFQRCVEGAQ